MSQVSIEQIAAEIFFFTSLSTRFPPVRPFLPLICAQTSFQDWGLVTCGGCYKGRPLLGRTPYAVRRWRWRNYTHAFAPLDGSAGVIYDRRNVL